MSDLIHLLGPITEKKLKKKRIFIDLIPLNLEMPFVNVHQNFYQNSFENDDLIVASISIPFQTRMQKYLA